MRVFRSTDLGQSWSPSGDPTNVDGVDGFVTERDLRMVPYHISTDPSAITNRVYQFYVRNEASPFLGGGGKRNVLYSRASYNGGDTWKGESRVYTISSPEIPATGFAEEPPNGQGNTDGFFRIGRVWSCVAPNGDVYVVWFDNRYGKFSATKDYWHVFYSKSTDAGLTWSVPKRVSGPDSSDLAVIKANASIGGFGNPIVNADHHPPVDFISCDVDGVNWYAVWPDSREAQTGGGNASTRVRFRRFTP